MEEKPKKSWGGWVQFRLSTCFFFIAIVAWVMSGDVEVTRDPEKTSDSYLMVVLMSANRGLIHPDAQPLDIDLGPPSLGVQLLASLAGEAIFITWQIPSLHAIWLALIIAAFVGWRYVARRLQKRLAPPATHF